MTADRPYTDDDLRAEAARQRPRLIHAPYLMDVSERMSNAHVDSDLSVCWHGLDHDDFTAACNQIHELIAGAADVSEWAVNLGADGLEPSAHTLQLGAKGPAPEDPEQPFVRLHFAFSPEASDEARDRFVMELSRGVLNNL